MLLGDSPDLDHATNVLKQNSHFNLKGFILSEDAGPRVCPRCAGKTDSGWIISLPVVGRVTKKLGVGSHHFCDCPNANNLVLQLADSFVCYHHAVIDQALTQDYAAYVRSWEEKCAAVVQGPVEEGGFGFSGLNESNSISWVQQYRQSDNFLYPGGICCHNSMNVMKRQCLL